MNNKYKINICKNSCAIYCTTFEIEMSLKCQKNARNIGNVHMFRHKKNILI